MTLEYEICKQLKEIGLEQAGDEWICSVCGLSISHPEEGNYYHHRTFCKNKKDYDATNIVDIPLSIPSTDQFITWLEGKKGYLFIERSDEGKVKATFHLSIPWPHIVRLVEIKDETNIKTALAKLCIELEREK